MCELVTQLPHVLPAETKSCTGATCRFYLGNKSLSIFRNGMSNYHETYKKKTKHEFSLSLCLSRYIYFPFLCSLSGVWLPYDNPDWSSCSSQLFLFNYITDWDINLRFATTVPGVGEGSL